MNSYNGWTGYERSKSHKLWLSAVARGEYAPPDGPCELCGNPKQMLHREDYNRLECHAICIECHMRIHGRFRFPNAFVRHVLFILDGGRPKVWQSVGQYLAANRGQSDVTLQISERMRWEQAQKSASVGLLPWWVGLSMKPIDLKAKLYGGTFQQELRHA